MFQSRVCSSGMGIMRRWCVEDLYRFTGSGIFDGDAYAGKRCKRRQYLFFAGREPDCQRARVSATVTKSSMRRGRRRLAESHFVGLQGILHFDGVDDHPVTNFHSFAIRRLGAVEECGGV